MRKVQDLMAGKIVRAAWVDGRGFQLRAMSCISVTYKRSSGMTRPKNERELSRLIAV